MSRQSDLRYTFEPESSPARFEVIEFSLDEGLSTPFRLTLELSSHDANIDFTGLLDNPAVFTLWRHDQPVRFIHGLVSSVTVGQSGFRRTGYRVVVEPQLARLALCSNWRIFQQLSVPQIIDRVLGLHHLFDREQIITAPHQPREYCVQAGETDLHFIARLAAEEGLLYTFKHSARGHRLIHTDRVLGLGQIGPDHDCAVIYAGSAGGDQVLPAITRFDYTEQVRTARQVQRDYTFTHPRYNQQHEAVGRDLQRQSGTYERYDFPGRYKRDAVGKPFTQTRLLALRNDARIAVAIGDNARLQPGLGFELHEHPREAFNTHWRTISIEHHGIQHSSQEEDAGENSLGTRYTQTAQLIDGRADWKSELLDKPRIDGPQTATVVGPPGEEIHCDEWGRVKLSFPWDRESQNNDTSSCWVRVSQGWAGTTWGAMAIPRIGQEVIVSYLDGDPDQPLIIGRTFRAANLPPYKLPLHKTRMTIKSQSHKGHGFNELRFEDELGQEEVFIHAQRDQNSVVKHDQTTRVGNDRSDHIEQDEKIHVGRDRSEVVGNDEHIRIGQDASLAVGRNQTLTVEQDRSESVGNNRHDRTTANHTLETGGNVEHIVQGQYRLEVGKAIEHCAERILLQASHSLVLEGPGGSLCIDASGITLNGVAIHLKGPVDMTSAGSGATLITTGSPNIAQAMDQICGRRADGTCFREPCNCAARGAS